MKNLTSRSQVSAQAGFSLVELMVAVTIGFIVIGAVGYLYIGSRGAFRTADNMSRMQESARYAMDTLTRDIRMAGYRGCASVSGTFNNVLNNSALNAYNFGQPLAGYDAQVAGWSPALPTGTGGLSGLGIVAGTDVVVLRSTAGMGAYVTQQPGNTSADLKVTTPNDLAINDIAMVTDCTNATVFRSPISTLRVGGRTSSTTRARARQATPPTILATTSSTAKSPRCRARPTSSATVRVVVVPCGCTTTSCPLAGATPWNWSTASRTCRSSTVSIPAATA